MGNSLVVDIQGLVDVQHIHAAFVFLNLPRREWRNGVKCFALASVRAFSILHMDDAVRCDEPTSDHEDGSDNVEASDSCNYED
jgi:hypothetical protein